MKKYFKYVFLAVIIIIGFFNVNNAHAQTSPYTMRALNLDTLGKTLFLNDAALNRDGTLTEFSGVDILKTWKVKYEHKGSSRRQCEPPVLNLSFDKTDSKGNPKELFTGYTTYSTYSQLQYQKIRLIPECDIWNDYWVGEGDLGFSGQLNVSLREYVVSKIFRTFGIPTADVIGFTNITFITPDERYDDKSFRYIIIQRPQEKDDQIPFTTQFNLNPTLYESGSTTNPWYPGDGSGSTSFNSLTGGTIVNIITKEKVQVSFDRDTTLRFLLLTGFLNVGDMGFLHNEDGGIDNVTGKIKSIPHGFDYAFSCNMSNGYDGTENPYYYIENLIDELPANKSSYQRAYYTIARDIFGRLTQLDKMITLVNNFPYPNVDKEKLKEYLRIKFYEYAIYFNSEKFATSMDQVFNPLQITLPFFSQEIYKTHRTNFINSCYRTQTALSDTLVSVANGATLTIIDSNDSNFGEKNNNLVTSSFVVNIKTNELALQVSKTGSAFQGTLVGAKVGNESNPNFRLFPVQGIEDYLGPYYVIPPHTNAQFKVEGSLSEEYLLKDTYYVKLNSFQPNSNITPLALNSRTNSMALGSLDPIVVVSPKGGEYLSVGSLYNIVWTDTPDRQGRINISISNTDGVTFYMTNPSIDERYDTNKYAWIVGKVYTYSKGDGDNNWIVTDLDPNQQYKITVYYSDNYTIKDESEYFTITSNSSNSTYPPGCISTEGYSVTTGVKCDSLIVNTTLPPGCISTMGYSPTSGVKCDSLVTNTTFPPGCTSNQGFSTTTGMRCDEPTQIYQPGCTSYFGFSTITGLPCSGSTSESISISNVSVTSNPSVLVGGGSTTVYNYNIDLTLWNSANYDVFLRNKGDGTDITAVVDPETSSVNYSRNATPISLPGDVPGVSLIIPAGSSRSLNFSGQLSKQGITGQVSYRVTSFTYGTSANNPIGYSFNTEQDDLRVIIGEATQQLPIYISGSQIIDNSISSTVSLSSPTTGSSITQGQTLRIAWNTTNAPAGSYVGKVNLFRGDALVQSIVSTNSYSASDLMDWGVSSAITPADNYRIQVQVLNADGSILAQTFGGYFRVVAPVAFNRSTSAVLGAESFHFTQFLSEGSYGNEVMELQKYLNKAGYDTGNVDGTFGLKVKEALIKFQTDHGLKGDGIVGYEVRTFLNK